MNIVRKFLVPASFIAALWFAAGCDGMSPFFDSTNLDPHPPVIRNLRVATVVRGLNATGVEVSFTYEDAGADIEELTLVDLGFGATQAENPIEPTPGNPNLFPDEFIDEATSLEPEGLFFPGPSGEMSFITVLKLDPGLAGRHVIKIVLTDSKESRSAPQYFIVEIVARF